MRVTRNHWWIHTGGDGRWHAGFDAVLADALPPVERVDFLTPRGVAQPAVAVHAGGFDYTVVFPIELTITRANPHLLTEPRRLTDAPYTLGWLYEGEHAPSLESLATGAAAAAWLSAERERITQRAHELAGSAVPGILPDGGEFQPGLLGLLCREDSLRLFHQHFSPFAPVQRTQ
jgi:hypothetical protein